MSISTNMIRDAVECHAHEILEWTSTLVRFPSENRPPTGNEAAAQEFIRDECEQLDLEVDVFAPNEIPGILDHPAWLSGRSYKNRRKDVVACWHGKGGGRSLLLSSHVDVAPFEPDNWRVCRPFEPIVKNGRLYGRGTADMKGGLAASFWAIHILHDLGFEPAGDVLFESVVDEEFASGNGTLAARLRGHKADLAINPEPTCMEVATACMGAFLGDLTLRSKAGIPYVGKAIPNPINGAARAVRIFEEWLKQWRTQCTHPLFQDEGKQPNLMLWLINSTNPGEFTQMGTPLQTRISWIVWVPPGVTKEEFYCQFRAFWNERIQADSLLRDLDVSIEPAYHYIQPSEVSQDDPAVQTVVSAFEQGTGRLPSVGGAPFSCDLSLFKRFGNMPAVLLGPRGDNLHAPDEWVEIEDIFALTRVFANLALKWCG